MAQPTQQQVLLDLFQTKKAMHKSDKTKVAYRTGSTTAKMKVQAKNERSPYSFIDKSSASRMKYLVTTEKNVSNGNNELQSHELGMHWQLTHLGSNWAYTDKHSAASGDATFSIDKKIEKASTLTNMKSANDDKFPKMEEQEFANAKNESIEKKVDENFLKYKPRLTAATKRQEQFLSYFNLEKSNENEKQEEESLQNPNERCLKKQIEIRLLTSASCSHSKPIPPEDFLSLDLTSPMGQKIWAQQLSVMDGTKKIDIDQLTCFCPKRISARSTKNSHKTNNFVVTFKEPKARREYRRSWGSKSVPNLE